MNRVAAVKSLAIIRRDDGAILVSEDHDPSTGELFHRPLGGSVEFGERAADAATRELREELGAELVDVRLAGVLENLFTFNGEQGHEIVFVFHARFRAAELYARHEQPRLDGSDARALWRSPADATVRLVPNGIEQWIDG
jgi:ADP-ribose pyrophosphatase YjhB (NUDIX family)